MPTYEYKCPVGHTFEKFYPKMNNQRRVKCPTCGKLAERQISGGAGLVFKGSGFYVTDYKRAGSGNPESTDESKPESKPEAKPATESKPDSPKKKKPSGDK